MLGSLSNNRQQSTYQGAPPLQQSKLLNGHALAQGEKEVQSKGPAHYYDDNDYSQREKEKEMTRQGDNYDKSCYYDGMSSYV